MSGHWEGGSLNRAWRRGGSRTGSTAALCERCKAPIAFARIGERTIAIDLKPDMRGQIAGRKNVHGVILGRFLKGDEGIGAGEVRYRAHPKTCSKPAAAPSPQQALF